MTAATDGKLTDHLATVLAARYAAALAGWDGEITEEFRRKLRALRSRLETIARIAKMTMKKMPLAIMTSRRLKAVRESRERGRLMHVASTPRSAVTEDG